MKNEENEMEKDDIINPEQFQVGRASTEDNEQQTDDAGYTAQEDQFADGKGTQLAEEFESNEADETAQDLSENQNEKDDHTS